jgi:GNAT superfamily N-acetyltransferase
MPADFESLHLHHAPIEDPGQSVARFKAFLERVNNPHVLLRSDAVVRSVMRDGGLFFVENEDGEVVATTAFYRHGRRPNQWAEIGSTAVAEEYQGAGIQRALYRHIIALMRLSDWPSKAVIAIVDEEAQPSYSNIERCKFDRVYQVPSLLLDAARLENWAFIGTGEKRLYLLSDIGIAEALEFVTANGREHLLTDKAGQARFWLRIDFAYLQQDGAREALIQIAEEIRAGIPGQVGA